MTSHHPVSDLIRHQILSLGSLLSLFLLLAFAHVGRASAATVAVGGAPGEKIYQEDFTDPAAVDTGAGATPGFDQSLVDAGSLAQISDSGGTVATPFDDASLYTFDASKIEVIGGVARLLPDPLWPSLVASWRFEEATWSGAAGEVVDGSPSGLDGTALGDAQVVGGGLHGSAASFDGNDDAVLIGQPASPALGPADSYTLSAWFRTTGDGALIAKADANFGQRQLYLFVAGGGLWGAVGGNQNQGPASGVSDGEWHHGVLVNRDDGGVMRYTLYLDGVANGTFDSGSVTNGSDILLGARRDSGNSGLAFELAGEMDEVTIFDRALDETEISALYADGLGRVVSQYPGNGPTVVESAGHSLYNASGLGSFTAVAGASHQGQLGFQLSNDGASWLHWDGTAWVAASGGETNDAPTVDANIAAFDASAGALFIRTHLLGDGSQPVEIDRLSFDFSRAPVFEAREILGPIAAGDRFDALRATISGEDANHSVRLRVLGADATTPVDEATLPGNTLGFDSAQLAGAGVDLSAIGAGEVHVEVIFENPLGDTDSAHLDQLEVVYLDPLLEASLSVTIDDDRDPWDYYRSEYAKLVHTIVVRNDGPGDAVEPQLALEVASPMSAVELHAPEGWSCDLETFLCLPDDPAASLAAGGQLTFFLEGLPGHNVRMLRHVWIHATVSAQNDESPSDNQASERTTAEPFLDGGGHLILSTDPSDGTDFVFDVFSGDPFDYIEVVRILDTAADGDLHTNLTNLGAWVPGPTGATQRPTPGWLLDRITCEARIDTLELKTGYDQAGDYVFDGSAIAVVDGVARLLEDPVAPDLVAQWRFEEASWNGTPGEVADSGPAGLGGTALGDANTIAAGHLGAAATFDGAGDAVLLGQPGALDLDPGQPFTLSAWFKTTGDGALIAKADGDFGSRQFYLFVIGDRLWGTVGGSQNQGLSTGVSDGQWHHAALVNHHDGGTMRYTLYLDGVADGIFDSGTATNSLDVLLGARRDSGNSGLAFQLAGELDEVAIIGRALTSAEIEGLYQGGGGRILGGYPTHGPSITPLSTELDSGFIAFTGFAEEVGQHHEGAVAYQLSADGSNWTWFDGVGWVVAGEGDHNDATTLDTAISSFPFSPAAGALWVRAFLLSDGSEKVELDRVRVEYTTDGTHGIVISQDSVVIHTERSRDVDCTFHNIRDPRSFGSLTVVQSSDPANGTDFDYVVDFGVDSGGQSELFPLDDGGSVDGVASQRSWQELDPGIITITQTVTTPSWYLVDIQCTSTSGATSSADFDDPAAYAYDPAKIELVGGVARLVRDPFFADLLGYWRMDEASWSTGPALDDSGNGLDATAIGHATTTIDGLIDRAGHFDGLGDGLVIGQPTLLDFAPASDAFTVSAWFRTTGDGAIIGKAEDNYGQRQVYLFVAGGQVHSNVGGIQSAGSGSGYADGQWHHVALVNEDVGGTMRHRLYVDGALEGDFASGSATNTADWMIGSRRQPGNVGTAFELAGEVDEVAIFTRALDTGELAELYGGGSGRPIGAYADDGPSLVPVAGTSVGGPLTGFAAIATVGDPSNLAFQLSSDGIGWQFWNGSSWVFSNDDSQRNDAATVHLAIDSFDAGAGTVWVRAFLLSDGSQAVALDRLELSWDSGGQITTQVETFTGTATVDLQGGQDVTCTFFDRYDEFLNGTIIVELEAEPAEGTDFQTTLGRVGETPSTFFLDHAEPDDGDVHGSTWTAADLQLGTYRIDSVLPQGWERADIECVRDSPNGTFVTDYVLPSHLAYAYDPEKIELVDDVARLRDDAVWTDLLAYWRFEEGSWNGTPGEVLDLSASGLHGMASGGATPTPGHLGDAAQLDGVDDLLSFGSPAALDLRPASEAFTISAWFRTAGNGAIVGKAGGATEQRQYYLFTLDDTLWSIVGGAVNSGTTLGVADDSWHLATLVNYDAGGGTMRHALYLDGQLEGDFASGSAFNTADVLVGARRADDANGGIAFPLTGQVDEVLIVGRDLSAAEVGDLWAAGAGKLVQRFPTDAPMIEQSGSIKKAHHGLLSFTEVFAPGNAGTVEYQVETGNNVWSYWDGEAWVAATEPGQRNSAQEIDATIHLLDVGLRSLDVRAYLISDGTQVVALDEVRAEYVTGGPISFTQLGSGLELELRRGMAARCTLRNTFTDPTTLTLVMAAEPADGRDHQFELGDLTLVLLDDAIPDDGDGIGSSAVIAQAPGSYELQVLGADEAVIDSLSCSGGAAPFTWDIDSRTLGVDLGLGEDIVCAVAFERHFGRDATITALTQTTGGFFHELEVADQLGKLAVVTEAALDGGSNPPATPQVYLYDEANPGWTLLTTPEWHLELTPGYPPPEWYAGLDLSSHGEWLTLATNGRPLGDDPGEDLYRGEIYRVELANDGVIRIPDPALCSAHDSAIDDTGQRIAFLYDCDQLNHPYSNLALWDDGVVTVADTSGCDHMYPAIANSSQPARITTQSTCDFGTNSDGSMEVLQWAWNESPQALTLATAVNPLDDGEYLSSLHVASAGDAFVYLTNAEALGAAGEHIIVRQEGDGTIRQIAPHIDADVYPKVFGSAVTGGPEDAPQATMAIDASGRHVVFLGSHPFSGGWAWIWAQQTDAGDWLLNDFGSGEEIYGSTGHMDRIRIVWNGAGSPSFYFVSPADHDGSNGDGSSEVWRATID